VEYIQLGDLWISRLGFGCDPLGGHAWGPIDSVEAEEAVALAVDLGVTIFDTADCYGRGLSEERLARALGGHRRSVALATKFGVRFDSAGAVFYDNSEAWLEEALAGSLRRLRTDYIDLYQVHHWDGKTPWSEILSQLERKREAGLIRSYGVSNALIGKPELAARPEGFASCSFEFSLANRRHEDRARTMRREWGAGFLSWGSLGQGVLGGNYDCADRLSADDRRRRATYPNFHNERLHRNLRIVEQLRECLTAYPGATPAQIAIRWILDYLDFSVALVGAKTRRQVRENVRAADLRLTKADLTKLDALSVEEECPIAQTTA
jgi:myo-inositol catabolism protein IolS